MKLFRTISIAIVLGVVGLSGTSGQAQQPTASPAPQKTPTAAEIEAKNKEIEAQNKQIEADNAVVVKNFAAGNEALNAGRLDEAITAYREAVRVRPDEPALLSNLAEALRRRGINSWNESLKAQGADKDSKSNAAKSDWTEAAASAAKALQILNKLPAEQQQHAAFLPTKAAAASARALSMRLVATKVDQTQANAAWDANVEYVSLTTEPAAKSALKGEGLQMLFDAAALDAAILHSRAVLKEEPQHLDANRVLGISLFASNDKVKMREALPHLEMYVDKAPDSDPQKAAVKEAIAHIKAQQPD